MFAFFRFFRLLGFWLFPSEYFQGFQSSRLHGARGAEKTKNTHTHTQAHKHTSTQAHKHTSTQAHKHTSTQAHKHTSTQAHKHTSTQAHKHTSTHTHTHTHPHPHPHPHPHTQNSQPSFSLCCRAYLLGPFDATSLLCRAPRRLMATPWGLGFRV